MPEGKSSQSSFNRNQRRRFQNAVRAGYTQRQAVRIANGTLRR